jgi:hypothetical protein
VDRAQVVEGDEKTRSFASPLYCLEFTIADRLQDPVREKVEWPCRPMLGAGERCSQGNKILKILRYTYYYSALPVCFS